MPNNSQQFLFFEPIFLDKIWGGTAIHDMYGFETSDKTGEYWAISAYDGYESIVAQGPYQGQTLKELFEKHRELFGNIQGDCFPLLVKIIDASDDLSVQVHPDDSYAGIHENGQLGKTECWYILDSKNSSIIYGHNQPSREAMASLASQGRWKEFLLEKPVKPGDFFMVEAGKIHAIKKGCLILEIQQSSDLTYRLYDYNRLDESGQKRELHLSKALDVIQFPDRPYQFKQKESIKETGVIKSLCQCNQFSVNQVNVNGCFEFTNKQAFRIICVINGEGHFNGVPVSNGMFFIIPSIVEDITVNGCLTYIETYV